mmetsp:Transcript_22693/g.31604  ORF Transcript_22693/g.31604 Transcript_22693/m.31604 type:complete len:561 (+) Transcript_22693:59-1741(+)
MAKPTHIQESIQKLRFFFVTISLLEIFVILGWFFANLAVFYFVYTVMVDGEFSPTLRAIGHLNAFNLGLLLLPVARNSVWLHLFGIPFEKALRVHRALARVVLFITTVHGLGWWYVWITIPENLPNAYKTGNLFGQAAYLCMFVMEFLAIEWFRRHKFELFYYTHHLFVVFVLLAALHSFYGQESWRKDLLVYYIAPGVFFYTVDRLARVYKSRIAAELVTWGSADATDSTNASQKFRDREIWNDLGNVGRSNSNDNSNNNNNKPGEFNLRRTTEVDVEDESSDITILEIERETPLGFKPGQYCFINIPSISKLQWHPFSITSSPYDMQRFSFHIKDMGPGTWTGQLHELYNNAKKGAKENELGSELFFSNSIEIKVDGPYGNVKLPYEHYKTIVLVAGGIGITPMISVLKYIYDTSIARQDPVRRSMKVRAVYLSWSVKKLQHLKWFDAFLSQLVKSNGKKRGVEFHVELCVTGDGSDIENASILPNGERPTKVKLPYNEGRANYSTLFSKVREEHAREKSIGVLVSGPVSMALAVSDMCTFYTTYDLEFQFNDHTFLL